METPKQRYYDLIKGKKFAGNQPVTLTEKSFDRKIDYFTTPKLDGLRSLIFFTDSKVYTITSKLEFKEIKLTKYAKDFSGVLLDAELYKGRYYPFDILFNNSIDLRKGFKLIDRLSQLSKIVKKINSKKLIEKKHTPLECSKFLKEIKDNESKFRSGELDGFILTPSGDYYITVFKWKPSYLLSNDFQVKNKGSNKYLLLLQNKTVFALKEFPGIGVNTYSKEQERFKDGEVAEFVFDKGKFVPLRVRPDKERANHISVILDNFREMMHQTDIRSVVC